MDSLTFLASLIGSVIWPLTLIIVLILFRTQLNDLVKTLKNLRYKELEINFNEEIGKIEKIVDEKELLPSTMKNGDKDNLREKYFELISSLEEHIISVADISPTASISLIWSILERQIRLAAMRVPTNRPPDMRINVQQYMQIFFERGYITKNTTLIFKELYNLRNKAVHNDPGILLITRNDVVEYWSLTKVILEKIALLGISEAKHLEIKY